MQIGDVSIGAGPGPSTVPGTRCRLAVRRRGDDAPPEGGAMPNVIITHDVAHVDTWLKGKADRVESVRAMGGSNVVDHGQAAPERRLWVLTSLGPRR